MGVKAPPKYSVGDRLGDFTVTYYCGHTNVNPQGKQVRDNQHWYEITCVCGAEEIVSQNNLPDRKRCKECTKDLRAAPRRPRPSTPPGIPDFATMRLTNM